MVSAAPLPRVTVLLEPDARVRFPMDWLPEVRLSVPPPKVVKLRETGAPELRLDPYLSTSFIRVNCEVKGNEDARKALADPRVWLLIALYFSVAVGTNVTGSYLPKLIKDSFEPLLAESGGINWKVGLLSTLPSILSVIAMVVVSRISDRSRSRSTLIAGALPAAAARGELAAAAARARFDGVVGPC